MKQQNSQKNQTARSILVACLTLGSLVFSLGAEAKSSSTSSTGPSLTLSYPVISAPAGSIAMTAVGSATITGTGGTTTAMAWNNATRYMYFNVAVKAQECRNSISGGQLVPNGSAIKTSGNNTYTVKQNFYCYSGAYKGWLSSFSAASSSVNVGSTVSSQVCLTQAAPAGGVVVKLVSAYGRVSVPTSVTVAAGSTCAQVNITGIKGAGSDQVFSILNGYAVYIILDVY